MCNTFLQMFEEDGRFIERLIMSDEADFELPGYVNKQNTRFGVEENPEQFHQQPLHGKRVTVWCGISCAGVIGPYYFSAANGATVAVILERQRNDEILSCSKTKELGI